MADEESDEADEGDSDPSSERPSFEGQVIANDKRVSGDSDDVKSEEDGEG